MTDLFDTSQFITRNHCGAWTPFLELIYIISNMMIATSYFIIPFVLMNIWRVKKHDYHASWMLVLFSTFIFLCGLTHLTDVTVFWWAPYRFYVLIYFLTGCVSFITMLLLPSVVRSKLRLMSREQYHKLNNDLQTSLSQKELAILEKSRLIDELKEELCRLERVKERGIWYSEQEETLQSLKRALTTRVDNGN